MGTIAFLRTLLHRTFQAGSPWPPGRAIAPLLLTPVPGQPAYSFRKAFKQASKGGVPPSSPLRQLLIGEKSKQGWVDYGGSGASQGLIDFPPGRPNHPAKEATAEDLLLP